MSDLEIMLSDFDIPKGRKSPTPENLRWLQRNIAIRNGDNPKLNAVVDEIKSVLDGRKSIFSFENQEK